MWVRALCDPPHGLESTTEQEVEGLGGDAEALGAMLDALLQIFCDLAECMIDICSLLLEVFTCI